ncbi:hypothetical protein EDB81DRAFT_933041 [Dactylonectria macrodidyma]|uniref:Uncharacterized protein n=1 Tax=Dactylonectria macrodidyma TaxID=307937 RepID=A0A9P9J8X9_9HYPO|nr:hypothetical protein EDB81DRAFT_933041 [Dactylonectria macrodidyma]
MRLFLHLLPACALVLGLATAQNHERYGSLPIAPNGLLPRFVLDKSNPVAKRADVDCGEDKHSCLDVGFGDECCDNDSYCYVNRSGRARCCAIGSNCSDDSACNSTAYFCTRTVTASGTPTAREGCCGRKCPETSLFLCPSSLGGNCCQYGAECRAGGRCASTQSASKTGSLTPIEEGCTTSQHRCADGNGCCNDWQHCTEVSSTGYCAAGNPSASISVVPNPDDGDAGLSNGAKAGIGVGAVLGTSIIVGALTWLCISKRRQRQRTLSHQSAGLDGSGGGQESAPGIDAMTDISGTDHSRVRQGLTQDYFGPDAVHGPFTEMVTSASTSPGNARAVPTQPQGPGDITAPVEIDSTVKEATPGNGFLSPTTPMTHSSVVPTPQSEIVQGRHELYGSDGGPPERRHSSLVPTPQESPTLAPVQRPEQ